MRWKRPDAIVVTIMAGQIHLSIIGSMILKVLHR